MGKRTNLAILGIALLLALGLTLWLLPEAGPQGDSSERDPAHASLDAAGADAAAGGAPRLEGLGGVKGRRALLPEPDAWDPLATATRFALTGRIVLSDGQPAPGARARVYAVDSSGQLAARADATADGGGMFTLRSGDGAARALLVTVDAPGHLYGFTRLAAPASGVALDLGDLALRAGAGTISGSVADEKGAPLEVQVDFERETFGAVGFGVVDADEPLFAPGVATLRVVSDPSGAFLSPPVPPGFYRLRVRGVGTHVREHVPAGTTGLRLVLPGERGTALRVAEVEVRFEGASDEDLGRVTPSGMPVLPSFYAGPYLLRAEPLREGALAGAGRSGLAWEGRAVSTWRVFSLPTQGGLLTVRGMRGASEDPRFGPAHLQLPGEGLVGSAVLPRAQGLRGRVVRDGVGVRAWIQVRYELGPDGAQPPGRTATSGHVRVEAQVTSRDDGTFEVPGLPPGGGELRACPELRRGQLGVADEFEPSAWMPVVFGSGGDLRIDVSAPAQLTLRLAWPAGEPLPPDRPAVSVVQVGGERRSELAAEARFTQGEVWVVVAHVPREQSVALAVACGGAWAETGPLLARAEPYRFALTAPARIEGRVLLPNGEPAREGQVWAVAVRTDGEPGGSAAALPRASCDLDAEGRFVLRPSAPGLYRLVVEDLLQGVVLPHEVPTGSRGVELRAQSSARIQGRVVGREGEDLRDFYVDAVVSGLPAEMGEGDWCGVDGAFSFTSTAERAATLVARAEDPRDERCAVLAIGAADVLDAQLVLRQGARVVGRVVDPSGAPVAGAQVSLTSALVSDVEQTDESGRFEFLGLPDEAWDLVVRSGARVLRQRVGPGEQTLTLPK